MADAPPQPAVGVRLDAVAGVDDRERDAGLDQRRHPLRVGAEAAPDVGEHDEVEGALDGAVQRAVAVDGAVVSQRGAEREAHAVQPGQALGRVTRVEVVGARDLHEARAQLAAQAVDQAVDEEVVVARADEQDARHASPR